MIVSLIGIITLQGIWISRAFEESEREFTLHINDALNAVNDAIDEDEAELFIEQKFGSVDSLLHEIIIVSNDNNANRDMTVIRRTDDVPSQTTNIKIDLIDSMESGVNELESRLGKKIVWNERMEIQLEGMDSLLESSNESDAGKNQLDHLTNVVRYFSTEKMFNGELAGRISKTNLKKKINAALKIEGIHEPVEYGVFDHREKNYAKGFISKGFNQSDTTNDFRKDLFEHDRIDQGNYSLVLQVANRENYVWNKVSSMIFLSVIFTILILLCFGYSIHFIFKQKKISQIKNDFINNMTHELKTPLASISLAAASIKHPEVINKREEVERFANIIENEERRMNTHIEQVLEIASLDKGELQLNFTETDLIDVLHASMKNVELCLAECKGTHTFQCDLVEAPIYADEFHLTNVFSNIFDNSIKYRKAALKLHTQLTKKDDFYRISIQDNGIGMSSKVQKLAFDKFYRAETGDIHNRKGFGLGLSYVKSIVEAHHGIIRLSSAEESGTTVIIQIPVKS